MSTFEHKLYLAGFLLYTLVELWLGRTPVFKAASGWELLYNVLHGIYELVQRRKKGTIKMSIEDRTVRVSKPVADAVAFVRRLLVDAISGKDSAALMADVSSGLPLFTELGQIPADAAADLDAVENSILLEGKQMTTELVAAFKAKGAKTPGK